MHTAKQPAPVTAPASAESRYFQGKRGRLITTIYWPEGVRPCPVILLCHGLPGTEKLQDFAIALREAGFCSILLCYSGAWGSDGDFSPAHCMEDLDTVIHYVHTHPEEGFDPERIFLLGHSAGGMLTCHAIASNPLVKGGAAMVPVNIANDFYDVRQDPAREPEKKRIYDQEFSPWLRNFSWEVTKQEIQEDPARFDLNQFAKGMSCKPVLLVAGNLDTVVIKEHNVLPLAENILRFGQGKLKFAEFDTDHGLNVCRNEIKDCVVTFFKSVCQEETTYE